MKKESWWEIFLMNTFKGAYHAKRKTNHEVVDLNEKEINNKYKTAIAKDIIFIALVAFACFTIGLGIGVIIR